MHANVKLVYRLLQIEFEGASFFNISKYKQKYATWFHLEMDVWIFMEYSRREIFRECKTSAKHECIYGNS